MPRDLRAFAASMSRVPPVPLQPAPPPPVPRLSSAHPLYQTWAGAMSRCYRPKTVSYRYYGARGIRVYEPWHDGMTFVAWIEANLGPRPAGMQLDRIDNDGNYEPGNLRWATRSEQNRNRRSNGKGWIPLPGEDDYPTVISYGG